MEKLNVFSNIASNKVFLLVMVFTVIFQVIIVEFLGTFANTVPLSLEHWGICVLLGFISIFVGFFIKLVPVPTRPLLEIFARSNSEDDGYRRLSQSEDHKPEPV
jgi:Ca2+-transporting ATPase